MQYSLLVSGDRKTFAREEIECRNISNAIEKCHEIFDERREIRVLQLLQDGNMIFKLERQST